MAHSGAVGFGVAAARAGDVAAAEVWYRAAADSGDVDGMNLLALIIEERGDLDGARRWYARAAGGGDTAAMLGLARLARRRGDEEDAGRWYREAAGLGDQEAMIALAESAPDDGDEWYRRAAEAGDPRALAVIGTRLRLRGELDEARRWLWRAVEVTGEPFFMVELGDLLAAAGDLAEAEAWHRRAAEAGDATAPGRLGAVLVAAGRPAEAEQWYRKAAASRSATTDLALLLVHRGGTAEAERLLERAADASGVDVNHALWSALPALDAQELADRERAAGHRVLVVLGSLAREREDLDRAERCFRRAADAGDAQAMYEMGMLLTRWGNAAARAALRRPDLRAAAVASEERPAIWFARAAEAGHPDAARAPKR